MEIEAYIKKMKDINAVFIDFVDSIDDSDIKFQMLINIIEKYEIFQKKEEVQILFLVISKIVDNHHRTSDFFNKLDKIFQRLIKDIPLPISYFIPDYKNYNKRVIFLLLEKGYVKPDQTFINNYFQNKPNYEVISIPDKSQSFYYLYPRIKKFINRRIQKQIEKEISLNFEEDISIFEKKCQIGENDSCICKLIREDLVEDFIKYVNRTNLSLSSKIKPAIYETNTFLIDKTPTLIEYASFFGSIQIIQYLKYNNIQLTDSLWIYGIHSNNGELIHFLEENNLKNNYNDVFIESIKCHHNDISNYIKDNLLEETITKYQEQFNNNFAFSIFNSLNFSFFPENIESIIFNPRKEKGFNLHHLCFSLKQITIPSTVTSIGENAFQGCSSIKKVIIPSSVTSIKNFSFCECSSLTHILFENPSSVTEIGNNAFLGCSSLMQISIPPSVKIMGQRAFYECLSLKEISIPSSVTQIGNYIFYGCPLLTHISIFSSVTSIEISSFSKCWSLIQINIPSTVSSIKNHAFHKCSKLKQIIIPSSVNSIGYNAFSECSSLEQITIPSSVSLIENYVFSKCSSLKQIKIPSSVTKIGCSSFFGCSSLEQITIPSSVISIGNYAFSQCQKLTQISIPSSVISIGNYAFSECQSLSEISIPSSITSIKYGTFCGCTSLIEISIPPSVTVIGERSFFECTSLKKIFIPPYVNNIGKNAFYGCSSLSPNFFKKYSIK